MGGPELRLYEREPADRHDVDCVEIYLPKSIAFLSELYNFLRENVRQRLDPLRLDGFSIYEVDGVFWGKMDTYDQRTLVIRPLFVRAREKVAPRVKELIDALGGEIARTIATEEEDIWVCRYRQELTVFRGQRRLLAT